MPTPRALIFGVNCGRHIDGGRGTVAAGDDKAVRDLKNPAGNVGAVQGGKGARSDRDVGHALRSVYVETVNEDIPSELLDLLGKLD